MSNDWLASVERSNGGVVRLSEPDVYVSGVLLGRRRPLLQNQIPRLTDAKYVLLNAEF